MLGSALVRVMASATIVAGLGAPAAHAGDWSSARTLVRPPLFDAGRIDGAGNDSGLEVFAWFHTTHTLRRDPRGRSGYLRYVRARTRAADGNLGPVRTVSRTDVIVDGPLVGVDRSGTATVAWEEFRRGRSRSFVMVAVARRGQRFRAPVQLGRGSGEPRLGFAYVGFDSPSPLAVSRDGGAVLAWNDGRRFVAALRPSGRCPLGSPRACFGAVTVLDRRGGVPAAAIGTNGTAAVTWAHHGIWLATGRGGRPFGTPRRVSPVGRPASRPAIAVAGDGSTIIAWRNSDSDSAIELHPGAIMAAVRDAQGHVTDAQTVDPEGGVAVAVAINSRGEAILRWAGLAAILPPGGVFGAPIVLAPTGPDPAVDAAYRQLAVDRRGRAAAVFARTFSQRPALGTFSSPTPIPGGASRLLLSAADKITTLWITDGAVRFSDLGP